MWMLDADSKKPVHTILLYLTVNEAQNLRSALETLLADPEAREHEHIIADGSDLSFSIVTDAKRKNGRYTQTEERLFAGKER